MNKSEIYVITDAEYGNATAYANREDAIGNLYDFLVQDNDMELYLEISYNRSVSVPLKNINVDTFYSFTDEQINDLFEGYAHFMEVTFISD